MIFTFKPRLFSLSLLLFSLLFSVKSVVAQYTCGTIHTPEVVNSLKKKLPQLKLLETFFLNNQQHLKTTTTLVPVKVHIVNTSEGTGGLTNLQLHQTFSTLNQLYNNAHMEFIMCGSVNYIDSDTYYHFDSSQEADLINTYSVDNLVNIYFVKSALYNGNSICGYAYVPSGSRNNTVIIDNYCALNGNTLAHELGHYFNLLHTHGGSNKELVNGSNCTTEGDLICDTPADPKLSGKVNSSCVYQGTETDANGDAYYPHTRNIMSYATKACRTEFTPQQYARIYASLQTDRAYLNCPELSTKALVKNELHIYLTANSSLLKVTSNYYKTPLTYTLFNGYGQLVSSGRLHNNSIDVSLYPSGIYMLSLHNNDTTLSKKFIK